MINSYTATASRYSTMKTEQGEELYFTDQKTFSAVANDAREVQNFLIAIDQAEEDGYEVEIFFIDWATEFNVTLSAGELGDRVLYGANWEVVGLSEASI